MSSPLDGQGTRHKALYYPMSDENAAELRDTDAEFRRLKAGFLWIASNRRRRGLSRSDSSRSPSPVRRQPQRSSANLLKFKIATFYSTDVELWFNQNETQFDLHQITDDDERYRLTCAALSGEVPSDVREVLLQPFLTHKYENLKAILIERRGLTTPGKVNKVISGEKLGSDIPSRFLRRLQKTAGFGTKAVVGKAVIRQAFMPPSVHAHLATQPDSASLENLAMLADHAVAAEKDVDEAKPGVAEINVSESGKLVGLLEDLSRRLKKLETATAKTTKKKTYGRSQADENRAVKTQIAPNVQAKPFIPNNQAVTRQDVSNNNKRTPQNNVAQPTDTVTAQVCYYHQTFGEKARLCSEPCSYYKTIGRREVANIASYPSQLLYVTDKHNKCNYLIDT